MNKSIVFILGTAFGAIAGSISTYYIVRDIKEKEKDEELNDMDDYYQAKIQLLKNPTKDEHIEISQDKTNDSDREKINSNEGVKKYHHDNGLESAYGAARIFGEDAKPVKKEKKSVIHEISEQEFLNVENGYTKQTVDIFMSNDDEEPEIIGIWAYNTDNEETVDKRFGKPTNELLNGRSYDDLLKYCVDVSDDGDEVEESIGTLYLKNEELKTDFEFVIHND